MSNVTPVSIPEMEAVSDEQEKKIASFVSSNVKNGSPPPPWIGTLNDTDLRILGYKFLVARKWNPVEAAKMLQGTIEHRKREKTDESLYFPPAFTIRGYDFNELNRFFNKPTREPTENVDKIFKCIAPYYTGTFHKWDKMGHPVMIELFGATNVRKLVEQLKGLAPPGQSYIKPACDAHVHFNEVGVRLVKYNDATLGPALGRRVLGVTAILDVQGLGYGHLWKPVLEVVRHTWAMDSSFYPEGLHRLFVVNCPSMIMFAYNIVKGWLDPRIQSKIRFCKPGAATIEALTSVIDVENLPEFLGGKCHCEGGCIHRPDAPDPSDSSAQEDHMTEEVTIYSGKKLTREFNVLPGTEVTWEWATSTKEVMFSVSMFADGSAGERIVVDPIKCGEGSDVFKSEEKGKAVLIWDNSFSWMTSKTLNMRVLKVDAQDGS